MGRGMKKAPGISSSSLCRSWRSCCSSIRQQHCINHNSSSIGRTGLQGNAYLVVVTVALLMHVSTVQRFWRLQLVDAALQQIVPPEPPLLGMGSI